MSHERAPGGARAVVLLSGGLDSATVLAIARSRGFDCYALSVDYGQRHRAELDAAVRVAGALGASRAPQGQAEVRAALEVVGAL